MTCAAGKSFVLRYDNVAAATSAAVNTFTTQTKISGGTLTAIASSPTVNVNPAAANKLAFGQQPTNATAGTSITPAVTVIIQDQYGNTVITSTAAITMAIGTN